LFILWQQKKKETGMRKSLWAGLSVLLLAAPLAARGDVIWQDGFESGSFAAWSSANGAWRVVTSPQSAHSGSRGADIAGPTLEPGGDELVLEQSSLGFEELEFSYWYKVREGLEMGDLVRVEWTDDGQSWSPLATYTELSAGDWQFASFALPGAAANNPDLGLRFQAELGSGSDRFNLDDALLEGAVIPEPSTLLLLTLAVAAARRTRSL
jgi:hypothetical protein